MDLDALAAKFGGTDVAPAGDQYDALAAKFGGADVQRGVSEIPAPYSTAPMAKPTLSGPQPSLTDKIRAGIESGGGAIYNMAASVPAMMSALVRGRGIVPEQNAAFDEFMGKYGWKPPTPLAADYTQNIGNALNDSGIVALAPMTAEMGALSTGARQAAPAVRAVVGDTAAKAVNAITPSIADPNTQALAQKFQDIGGKVPLHTLSGNKYVRMAGEAIDNLPISGSTKTANKLVVNQELLRQMGGNAPGEMLTPSNFGPAMDKAGSAIGEIYGKVNVPLDETFKSDLGKLFNAQKLQDAQAVGDPVRNYIGRIANSADESGAIPGDLLRAEDSALGTRIRGLPPGDLRSQLSDLQEVMRDALSRQLTGEDATNLQTYRRQYAIGKQLEPLVAKSVFQGVSPQALMGRETATAAGKSRMARGAAGDMGDLANIGQRFIKEQPSSGSGERAALFGAAGLLGAGIDTARAAGGALIGNAYNRLGPILSARIINKGRVSDLAATPSEMRLLGDGELPPGYGTQDTVPRVRDSGLLGLGEPPAASSPAPQMSSVEFPSKLAIGDAPPNAGPLPFSTDPQFLRTQQAIQNAERLGLVDPNAAPVGRMRDLMSTNPAPSVAGVPPQPAGIEFPSKLRLLNPGESPPDALSSLANVTRTEAPSVADIHALAKSKGIPFDNNPDFMRLTQAITGKQHLDALNGVERQTIYDHLNKTPSVKAEPPHANELRSMASEAGWAQVGGRMIRSGDNATPDMLAAGRGPESGDVVGRTTWIPKADWFQRMRQDMRATGLTSPRDIQSAVDKYFSNQKMTPMEQRTLDWMVKEAQATLEERAAPPDNWLNMTEAEKNEELDSIFGPKSSPDSGAELGISTASPTTPASTMGSFSADRLSVKEIAAKNRGK